ncbi:MAG: hypothetical protein GC153_00685 [Alphaproteobacteria bacterium]|nr:hypothetical protein [Alphaproteobacteria bacterium]
MEIEIIKGERADIIRIRRSGGAVDETTFPKKGPIPHDAVHVIVEDELGLRRGFWGMVGDGRHPEDIQAIAKEAGHASAKRAGTPDASIVELIQAERLVECFEAEAWSAPADDEAFRAIAAAACSQSHVPAPLLRADAIATIRARLARLKADWTALPVGESLRFSWGDGGEAS